MSEVTPRCGFEYEVQSSEAWYHTYLRLRQMLDRILCPDQMLFVSPEFTSGNLYLAGTPTDRRHFDTIQGAINAWESGGFGAGDYGAIVVFPGQYSERLSITRSVALVASHHSPLGSPGAGAGVLLKGDGTVGPLIDFDPVAEGAHRVLIRGFTLANSAAYSVGEQATMVVHCHDQGLGNYGPYHNALVLDDCNGLLTSHNNNSWQDGCIAEANTWLMVSGGRYAWPSDGAALYVRHPFRVDENAVTGKQGRLSISNARVLHYPFAGPSSATVLKAAAATGLITRSSFNRTFADGVYGHAGAGRAMAGLGDATAAAAYGNLIGVNTVEY